MRFKIFIVVVVAIPFLGFVQSDIPPNFEALLDDLINNYVLPRNQQPGLALTIVKGDGSYNLTKGYGLQDIAKNTTIDGSTLFLIGSISKSFTGTLVVKVLNEKFPQLGEAALDVPIAKLWSSCNFTLIDRARAESVSFRDLLAHRVCLARAETGITFQSINSVEEYIYRSRYVPEGCPLRTDYIYNNALFVLAGELAAQINGNNNFTDLLQSFLGELDMRNTTVVRLEDDFGTWDKLATPYYLKDGDLVNYNLKSLNRGFVAGGAGGIISTAEDMSKYLRFHLNQGKVGGKEVVPEEVLKWAYRASHILELVQYKSEDLGVNGDFANGLGHIIGFFEGRRYIHHDGYIPPYLSEFSLFPDLNIGVFSASSSGIVTNVTLEKLHGAIAKLAEGEAPYEVIKQELLQRSSKTTTLKQGEFEVQPEACANCIQADLGKVPGVYGNPSQGEIQISLDETDPKGNVKLQFGVWGKAYIRETPSSQLLVEWDSEVIVADFLAQGGSVPDFFLNFVDEDNFYLDSPYFLFTRNLTFESLPEIPWAPGSCTGA